MLNISRLLLGLFFIIAGINHFIIPELYIIMVPPFVPYPRECNALSGAAEIIGGVGVLTQRFRLPAAWGLVVLLIAVFPANVFVALYGWQGTGIPRWVLWFRLPFQAAFIAWVYFTCIKNSSTTRKAGRLRKIFR